MSLICRDAKNNVRAAISNYDGVYCVIAYRHDRNIKDRLEFNFNSIHDAISCYDSVFDLNNEIWNEA